MLDKSFKCEAAAVGNVHFELGVKLYTAASMTNIFTDDISGVIRNMSGSTCGEKLVLSIKGKEYQKIKGKTESIII